MIGIDLVVAGHPVARADLLVARYCGLTGEQWAYAFYDCVPVHRGGVTDLLAASVMHGPLSRADLQWFADTRPRMLELIDHLPEDTELTEANDGVRDVLADGVRSIAGEDPRTCGLLTKILHRHHPALVVIDERHVGRLFAQARGIRGRLPYRQVLDEVAATMRDQQEALDAIQAVLAPRLVAQPLPTRLRLLDIAIWMEAHR